MVSSCVDSSDVDSDWSLLQFVPVQDLWFDDGNIIIRTRARPSQPGAPAVIRGFKCHKSVLSVRSQLLTTMFSEATEGQTTLDGVPCFDMPDDFEHVRDNVLMCYRHL